MNTSSFGTYSHPALGSSWGVGTLLTLPTLVPTLVLTLSLGVVGCGEPPRETPRFPVTISVESDPGIPLRGVTFDANGSSIGESDELGLVHTMLEGPEGTTVDIHHVCPEGYASEDDTKSLALIAFQSVADTTQGLEMTVRCAPTVRRVGFVINSGRAGLPVMINGDEMAVTDDSGVAHVMIDSAPNASFRVMLATSDFSRLSPVDPVQEFTLGDRADVFVVRQEFEEAPLPSSMRRRRRRRRRPPSRITRLH